MDYFKDNEYDVMTELKLKQCYICDCWVRNLKRHNKSRKHIRNEVSYFWSENPINWDNIPEEWKLEQE